MEVVIVIIAIIIILFSIALGKYASRAERNKGILLGIVNSMSLYEREQAGYLTHQYSLNKEKIHQFTDDELYEWIDYEIARYRNYRG
jgi:uncharacterized membrane protein YkgB